MSITIARPDFRAVSITPNPATINATFTIVVDVADILAVLEPELLYSGEIYSGEV